MGGKAKVLRGGEGLLHLIDGPFLPGLGVAAHGGGCEAVEGGVIGGVDGDKLTFQFPLADGNLIVVALKVEGDKMTGSWTHQEGDTGALSFERKK